MNGLSRHLKDARSVLVAGAGGGFDVFCGLPLALQLREAGKQVHFANLSFTYLGGTDAEVLAPALYRVTSATKGEDRYCPERALAAWLEAHGQPGEVFAFEKTGVLTLKAAYALLRRRLGFDAVVLVDGGTDILMRGDEAGLGTPEEDMASLAAVSSLGVTAAVACLGFGVDAYHGVCHAHFLENVAALERAGGYLGAFSISRSSPEGTAFLDAVEQAQMKHRSRQSIVNGSIAAALRGEFGNFQFTERTGSSELFINPLMGIYFTFDLAKVAAASLYLPQLMETTSIFEVSARIEAFRHQVTSRPYRSIPH